MKNLFSTGVVAFGLLGVPILAGCDRASTEKTETHSGPNGTSVDKTKTTVDSNGNTTKSEEHKSTP